MHVFLITVLLLPDSKIKGLVVLNYDPGVWQDFKDLHDHDAAVSCVYWCCHIEEFEK